MFSQTPAPKPPQAGPEGQKSSFQEQFSLYLSQQQQQLKIEQQEAVHRDLERSREHCAALQAETQRLQDVEAELLSTKQDLTEVENQLIPMREELLVLLRQLDASKRELSGQNRALMEQHTRLKIAQKSVTFHQNMQQMFGLNEVNEIHAYVQSLTAMLNALQSSDFLAQREKSQLESMVRQLGNQLEIERQKNGTLVTSLDEQLKEMLSKLEEADKNAKTIQSEFEEFKSQYGDHIKQLKTHQRLRELFIEKKSEIPAFRLVGVSFIFNPFSPLFLSFWTLLIL